MNATYLETGGNTVWSPRGPKICTMYKILNGMASDFLLEIYCPKMKNVSFIALGTKIIYLSYLLEQICLKCHFPLGHMVKDHSDIEKGNPLSPHRLLSPVCNQERVS